MAYLKALPEDAVLPQVFNTYPATSRPLIEYHQILLRGSSPFTVAERELIAAYVSGLNACHYCHGVHSATARAFGVAENLLGELLADVDTAAVEDAMKPVLRYVRKLTLTPSRITPADAEALYEAGWDDQALHDAVSVCALYNFMNRLVEGLGVDAPDDYYPASGERLLRNGYAGLLAALPKA